MRLETDAIRWLVVAIAVGAIRVAAGLFVYHLNFSVGGAEEYWHEDVMFVYTFAIFAIIPFAGGLAGQFDHIMRSKPRELGSGAPSIKRILIWVFIGCLAVNVSAQLLIPGAQAPYPSGQPLVFLRDLGPSVLSVYGPLDFAAFLISTILYTLVDPLEVAALVLVGATTTRFWT